MEVNLSGEVPSTSTETTPTSTSTQTTQTQSITFPENWKDALDEDIRKDPSMGAIKDIKALAKSYIHAQRAMGAEKIVVPGKHATDEDWGNVFKKLGLPEKEKYDVKFPENFDKSFQDNLKETLYGTGVLPKQAQKIVDFYNEYTTKTYQAHQEAQTAQKAQEFGQLHKEWGDAFNTKIATATSTFQKFVDDPATMQALDQAGFTSDPKVVKLFAKIGEMLGEDKVVDPKGAGGFSPADINAKISEIMGDTKGAYYTKTHPGHEQAVQQVQQYFKMLERF